MRGPCIQSPDLSELSNTYIKNFTWKDIGALSSTTCLEFGGRDCCNFTFPASHLGMPSISDIIKQHTPKFDPYEDLYKHYHKNPELSFVEKETSASIAAELSKRGVKEVHTGIGGYGLVGVVKNGDGPIVLLRADIDGLPLAEQTGLDYASTKRMKDSDGDEKPVMHACGHDMHFTSLLAATELMVNAKDAWAGTLLLCFQPAEEKGAGAKAMVDDGLYNKVPKPDVLFGAHVFPFRAGTIFTRCGSIMASADSFHVKLHGRGSHGSQPNRSIDPVVMASSIVMRLQTIRSREVDPAQNAVITVGALNAGDTENIIPFEAVLKINVRNFDTKTRKMVLASIKRIIKAECTASNAPKPPEIKTTSSYPLTVNDDDVTAKLQESFEQHFPTGEQGYTKDADRMFGSEDFGRLGSTIDRPYSYFMYGGIDQEQWDKAEKEDRTSEDIPTNHSAFFAPAIQPTMRIGMEGYAAAALTWLAKK